MTSYRINENIHTAYSYSAASFFLDDYVRTGLCTHGDGDATSYILQEPKVDELVESTAYGAGDDEQQGEYARGMVQGVSAVML